MRGILFVLRSYDIVQRYEVDLGELVPGVELTPGLAYQAVKVTRDKFKIKGKSFIFFWMGRAFYITKVSKDETKTYELDLTSHEETYHVGSDQEHPVEPAQEFGDHSGETGHDLN